MIVKRSFPGEPLRMNRPKRKKCNSTWPRLCRKKKSLPQVKKQAMLLQSIYGFLHFLNSMSSSFWIPFCIDRNNSRVFLFLPEIWTTDWMINFLSFLLGGVILLQEECWKNKNDIKNGGGGKCRIFRKPSKYICKINFMKIIL